LWEVSVALLKGGQGQKGLEEFFKAALLVHEARSPPWHFIQKVKAKMVDQEVTKPCLTEAKDSVIAAMYDISS
jgi:hypothetical protein